MFTGIIEETGTIASVTPEGGRIRLVVKANLVLKETKKGDSINIEGVCQTVADFTEDTFSVFTLAESLKKTTLGSLQSGSKVNLERALRPDSRMGGHFVQGHVTCTVPIKELSTANNNVYLKVEAPENVCRCCVPEGSISLDGMSLTIAKIEKNILTVNIIPATFEGTTLKYKKVNDKMNLETDVIGRYVEKLLSPYTQKQSGLSAERMKELGY